MHDNNSEIACFPWMRYRYYSFNREKQAPITAGKTDWEWTDIPKMLDAVLYYIVQESPAVFSLGFADNWETVKGCSQICIYLAPTRQNCWSENCISREQQKYWYINYQMVEGKHEHFGKGQPFICLLTVPISTKSPYTCWLQDINSVIENNITDS